MLDKLKMILKTYKAVRNAQKAGLSRKETRMVASQALMPELFEYDENENDIIIEDEVLDFF